MIDHLSVSVLGQYLAGRVKTDWDRLTREGLIDAAVKRATSHGERRVLAADFDRYQEWPLFNEHVLSRVRDEFRRISGQ